MNTCKLIFRNVCKNIRDYLIYFLTLTLSVSLFYAFNSISDQPAFSNMGMTGTLLYRQLGIMLSTLSTMIAVVLAFLILYRRVHETPSGNQTDFFYCNQSRNGLTLSTFRDSTLKNMPAGQWRCIIGQTDTLLSVSSRTAGAPRCFSLKSGAITTTPQCKRGCLRAMTYRQADTPLPSKSERSERRRQ